MLIVRKEAEKDIRDAYLWYEEKQARLGRSFLAELDSVFEKIEEHPEQYGIVFGNLRRALCRRFPYSVYFLENPQHIAVLAVLHQRRSPAEWQNRR